MAKPVTRGEVEDLYKMSEYWRLIGTQEAGYRGAAWKQG